MQVHQPPAGEVCGADVEAVAVVDLDEAGDDVDFGRRGQQLEEGRVVGRGADGHVPRPVAQRIAGQRQFGEDDQRRAGGSRLVNGDEVGFQIGGDIAEGGGNLGQGNVEFHREKIIAVRRNLTMN